MTDYREFTVLYVDDEEKSLTNFSRAFGDQFRILTAPTARAGLALLEKHQQQIGILMSDQRMPGEKGVWLLEKARQLEPRILRILVTAYADMDAAIEAVNSGAIFKYVTKPWDPPVLETLLKRALDYFVLQAQRDQLLREKVTMLRNLMIADRVVSLGLLAAGMSHHIRNALVSVRTFIELAPSKVREEIVQAAEGRAAELNHPDFWSQYRDNALEQVDKINRMLRDLWTAAEKPDSDLIDRVHLQRVVPVVMEEFQDRLSEKEIKVTVNISDDLPPLKADARKFSRLFELLLEDELVFLPEGSHIRINARADTDADTEQPEVQIEILDDGPGLPEQMLRTIFDPFSTRDDIPSEYGIRLMACFFIVHYHRGHIVAQSAEGKGTRFVLRIPMDPGKDPDREESQMFLQRVQLNDEVWGQLLSDDDQKA